MRAKGRGLSLRLPFMPYYLIYTFTCRMTGNLFIKYGSLVRSISWQIGRLPSIWLLPSAGAVSCSTQDAVHLVQVAAALLTSFSSPPLLLLMLEHILLMVSSSSWVPAAQWVERVGEAWRRRVVRWHWLAVVAALLGRFIGSLSFSAVVKTSRPLLSSWRRTPMVRLPWRGPLLVEPGIGSLLQLHIWRLPNAEHRLGERNVNE